MLSKQHGASLIELMLAVVIVSVLSMLAIPSYQGWIQNQQIRTATESILNGIQLARSEAVKNNGRARFVLCGLPVSSWEVLSASAAAAAPTVSLACGTGSNAATGEVRVQERSGQEGSRLAQVAINLGSIGVTTITTVTFNSFGRVVTPNADGTVPITQIDVSTPTGRALRVTVGTGGNTRMCDPSPLLASTDPRHC
ncbi:MAG: GspH/FimT family pseudopilin [Nitrosomonadales bacterium]|jgi:type IV fimbrial biogenesis protein FimT